MSVTLEKKKAWSEFSKFIRLRDSLLTTGSKEICECITCGAIKPTFKTRDCIQAGHFIQGRGATILFVEDNCHGQCKKCNKYLHGNLNEYYPKMVELVGQERVDELRVLGKQVHQWKKEELTALKEKYREDFRYLDENN